MEESSPSRANIYRGDGRKPGLINKGVGEGAPRDLELSGQQTLRGHQEKNLEKQVRVSCLYPPLEAEWPQSVGRLKPQQAEHTQGGRPVVQDGGGGWGGGCVCVCVCLEVTKKFLVFCLQASPLVFQCQVHAFHPEQLPPPVEVLCLQNSLFHCHCLAITPLQRNNSTNEFKLFTFQILG